MEKTLEKNNSANSRFPIWGIAVIALFLRLLIAWFNPNGYPYDDMFHFVLPWMQNMHENGLLAMYKDYAGAAWALDYPPLYYICMYFTTGKLAAIAAASGWMQMAYFLCRAFPCMIDGVFTYVIAKRDRKLGWFWCFALPALADVALMGQSDCLLIFEAYLMFYFYLDKKNLKGVSIMYAIMACTKLQSLYFLPIFLLMVYTFEAENKQKIKDFLCGVGVGALIWLPWLVIEGPQIFFKIYLGGYGRTKVIASNACNIFFMQGMNVLKNRMDSDFLYMIISYTLLGLCVWALWKKFKQTNNILFASFFYLLCIYMFTFQQRERYEMYAFGVLAFAVLWHKEMVTLLPHITFATFVPIISYVYFGGVGAIGATILSDYIYVLFKFFAVGENFHALYKTRRVKRKLLEKEGALNVNL